MADLSRNEERPERLARREIRWLLENRTQIDMGNISRLLDRFEAEVGDRYWAALARGLFRAQELGWCNKDDDCHTQARGARLAMNDIGEALKDLEPSLPTKARDVLTALLGDPDDVPA